MFKIDEFLKNIIIVFAGASLVNLFNLLYQLLVVHKLTAVEFAAFNSLLCLFMIICAPLATIQLAVAKYSAQLSAAGQQERLKFYLSTFFKKALALTLVSLPVFFFASLYLIHLLKIPSLTSAIFFSLLLATSGFVLIAGAIQGLELFKWQAAITVLSGVLKLALAFIFISLGFHIAGALAALLVATLAGIIISCFPLRRYLFTKTVQQEINYKELISYLFPLAFAQFCFMAQVNMDMVLVRYFFLPQDSGYYSLSQMLGKIFLFFPGAISLVMFPRAAGLKAKNLDPTPTLKRSLIYAGILCVLASAAYNLFPSFILRLLTGKVYPLSISLGRLFSISMSLFALSYILVSYFLSLKDLRFLKYLGLCTALELGGILLFHSSLFKVQLVLCLVSIFLFSSHLLLILDKRVPLTQKAYPVTG